MTKPLERDAIYLKRQFDAHVELHRSGRDDGGARRCGFAHHHHGLGYSLRAPSSRSVGVGPRDRAIDPQQSLLRGLLATPANPIGGEIVGTLIRPPLDQRGCYLRRIMETIDRGESVCAFIFCARPNLRAIHRD